MRYLRIAAFALAATATALVAVSAGCNNAPDQQIRIGEDVIATYYDKKTDFGAFQTFSLAPEVRRIGNVGDAGSFSGPNTDTVLAYVAGKLTERGYREVAPDASPDMGVLVSVLLIPTTVTYDPYYWYGYYYPPGYWGYPYYGYYPAYGYTTVAWVSGTLAIDVVDLKAARAAGLLDAGAQDAGEVARARLPIVWSGYVYGVLDYTGNVGRAFDGIDQAFTQSPYFTRRTP
jgi:hypothetical protein